MGEKIRLGYSENDKTKYKHLVEKSSSPFHDKDYADVFIFALSLAIAEDLPPTKLERRVDNIPITAFGKTDGEWLLNAIALSETKNHEILMDPIKVYEYAEKYANSGIKLLYKEVFEKEGDFYKRFEEYCRQKTKNLKE